MAAQASIGLFGTCGNSQWRDAFTQRYQELGIDFFNPNKADWSPDDALLEAEHLASDGIVVFAITGETTGTASLAEIGFAVIGAIKSYERRTVVVFIEKRVSAELLAANPGGGKDSNNARAIVLAHADRVKLPQLHVVEGLDALLSKSLELYEDTQKKRTTV
jgi:hypothetical protein